MDATSQWETEAPLSCDINFRSVGSARRPQARLPLTASERRLSAVASGSDLHAEAEALADPRPLLSGASSFSRLLVFSISSSSCRAKFPGSVNHVIEITNASSPSVKGGVN